MLFGRASCMSFLCSAPRREVRRLRHRTSIAREDVRFATPVLWVATCRDGAAEGDRLGGAEQTWARQRHSKKTN